MNLGDFDRAVSFVLQHEGGLSHHPADRGGATNWGITQATCERFYPGKRVEELQIGEAREIYRELFWGPIQGEKLPAQIALALLDFAVHSGPGKALRTLQEAVGATADGIVGPKTLDRVFARHPAYVAVELCRRRVDLLVDLCRRDTGQLVFLKGWLRRVIELVDAVHRA